MVFPQQWRHVAPPPSPQVNRKHWGKRSCQPPHARPLREPCGATSKGGHRPNDSRVFSAKLGDPRPADCRWSDEGRGGSEVTWQTVHVIIVILVALWWDGLLGRRWSSRRRVSTLPQAAPDHHHPHPHLTDPEYGSLAGGSGGEVEAEEEEGVKTQLQLGSYTPTDQK